MTFANSRDLRKKRFLLFKFNSFQKLRQALQACVWAALLSLSGLNPPGAAQAFEIDPEFQTLATESGFQLINPALIDSEYTSDTLTYTIRPEKIADFFRQRMKLKDPAITTAGSVLVSAGSLSATQFDQKLRAEVVSQISERLRFRFLRTENRNYEENSGHSIFELETRWLTGLTSNLFFSAYGEVTRFKKEDDVGFALTHRREAGDTSAETRAYFTFVDFTRTERNDGTDRFSQNENPASYGIVHRRLRNENYFEFSVRRESSTKWIDPSRSQNFFASKTAVSLMGLRRSSDSSFSLRGQWDRTKTAIEEMAPALPLDAFQIRDRDRFQIELRRSRNLGLDSGLGADLDLTLETGLLWTSRTWMNETGQKLFHQNTSPFVGLIHSSGFEIDVETTIFQKYGNSSLGSSTTRDQGLESRLNTRWRHKFSERAELQLALTADLDGFDGGVFEGGLGQFHMSF